MTATWRATQKANRREALMQASAKLFAERGFNAVSTVELGEAVGMSGPALYNYFPSKEALLSELLVDMSTRLYDASLEIIAQGRAEDAPKPPEQILDELITFHVDFAINEPDRILLQGRELRSLPAEQNRLVRKLQQQYTAEWRVLLQQLHPEIDDNEALTRLRATFALLNSTPHSAPATGERASTILASMARAALTAPVG